MRAHDGREVFARRGGVGFVRAVFLARGVERLFARAGRFTPLVRAQEVVARRLGELREIHARGKHVVDRELERGPAFRSREARRLGAHADSGLQFLGIVRQRFERRQLREELARLRAHGLFLLDRVREHLKRQTLRDSRGHLPAPRRALRGVEEI